MRIKDVIALGFLALVSFPVVLLGVLMWTGNVRLAFGPEDPSLSASRERLQVRPEDLADVADLPSKTPAQGHGDGATMLREAELDSREAQVQRDLSRLEELRIEDSKLRDTIVAERKRVDILLSGKDSLEQSRLVILARTFTGMKPDQAARILSGLDDILVTGILRAVKDDKPRAKLLAAFGKADPQRAAMVARLLRSVDPISSASSKNSSEKLPVAAASAANDSSTPSKAAKP